MLDELSKKIKEVSDEKLNETISKGGLKLDDEQIATVSFAFWLVYLAETDLNTVLTKAWTIAKSSFSPAAEALAEQKIREIIGGTPKKCPSCGASCGGREIDINNPEYFVDKIKIYRAFFGSTERTNLFWKLNDIRNDLSHNRIEQLKYDGNPIAQRVTKEKVLMDYFRTALEVDRSQSEIWNSLTEDEKREVESLFENSQRDHGVPDEKAG